MPAAKPIDVSIVVCTLNEEKNIEGCLRALRDQKFSGNYEIILADGNSEDNTVKLAKPFAARTKLSWIVDALGPEGRNFLTQQGIVYIERVVQAQLELDNLLSRDELEISSEQLEAKLDAYHQMRDILVGEYIHQVELPETETTKAKTVRVARKGALVAFEDIAEIVEARYHEGLDGKILLFDTELPALPELPKELVDSYQGKTLTYNDIVRDLRDIAEPGDSLSEWLQIHDDASHDIQMANSFKRHLADWVSSGLGDPELARMTVNEQLQAVSNFPDALKKAFELAEPELSEKTSLYGAGFGVSSAFPRISVSTIELADGSERLYRSPVAITPENIQLSGPTLDR